MRRKWTKPELYVEEFELSQHVAAGCGPNKEIKVEEEIHVDYAGCKNENGGHWGAHDITLVDTNKNGSIDWEEFANQVGTACNGVVTGGGHEQHGFMIRLESNEVITMIPENS